MHHRCPDSFKILSLFTGEEFLKPTRIYTREVLPLIENAKIKAFAHITGGGLLENVPRIIPKNLKVDLDANLWDVPPVFAWIATQGLKWFLFSQERRASLNVFL